MTSASMTTISRPVQIQAIYQAGSLTLMAPANGATNASPVGALSWQGRYDAAAWDLYLGTDETAVTNADLSTYVGRLDRPFDVPEIAFSADESTTGASMKWRGTGPPRLGPVWRFTPDLTGEAYVENPGFEIPATVKQTTANVPGWNDGGGVEKGGAWSSWLAPTPRAAAPRSTNCCTCGFRPAGHMALNSISQPKPGRARR